MRILFVLAAIITISFTSCATKSGHWKAHRKTSDSAKVKELASTITQPAANDPNKFTSIELRIEMTTISKDEHHPTPMQGYIAKDGTLKLLTVAKK